MYKRMGELAAVIASAAALAMAFGGAASASTGTERMQLGAQTQAPSGFLRFCIRNPGACPRAEPPPPAAPADERQADGWWLTPGWGALLVPASFSLRDLDRGLRAGDDTGARLYTSAVREEARPEADDRSDEPVETVLAVNEAGEASGEIALTREARKLLHRVNRDVNRHVRPRSDMQLHGRAEHWGFPVEINGTLYGDCEDYALEKKRRLIEAGVPAAVLTLAVVHTRQREVHAVLLVATDQGDLVLDNRAVRIRPWTRTNYNWIMRQVSGDSLKWAQIAAPASA